VIALALAAMLLLPAHAAHRDTSHALPKGAHYVIVEHAQPTNLGRMVDTLIEMPAPPRARHASGIALRGVYTIFDAAMAALVGTAETDTFTLQLPSATTARMQLHVGGVTLPLKVERDTLLPPWAPGQPPATPGIALRARMYSHDVLHLWGYDAGDAWVGRLEMHTTTSAGRDTVYAGTWHTFGPATALTASKPSRRLPKQIKFQRADPR